jgi:hypothetical protein
VSELVYEWDLPKVCPTVMTECGYLGGYRKEIALVSPVHWDIHTLLRSRNWTLIKLSTCRLSSNLGLGLFLPK